MDINDIMTLTDIADYLKIAPKTVSRMIQRGEIPCMKIAGQWRFKKSVIDTWLKSKMNFSEEHNLVSLMDIDSKLVPLSRLLAKNMIIMHIKPGSIEDILASLVKPLKEHGIITESQKLLSNLLAREHMVSTAVGNGTAFPHIRNVRENPANLPPIVMGICPEGTDYGCLDGSLTHVFYLLLADSETVHLRILSRLAAFARKPKTLESILEAKSPDQILRIFMEEDYESLAKPQA